MASSLGATRPGFLSTAPPKSGDRRFAFAVVAISSLFFLGFAPFARHQLPQVFAFIPIYEAAIVFSDLITAAIFLILLKILRSRSLMALACGYLFTALMAVSHALTFPGLFSATGLLSAGLQSTAWLYVFWHGGFPLAVIAYALLKNREDVTGQTAEFGGLALGSSIGAVVATVVGLTLLATAGEALLPEIMPRGVYGAGLMIAVGTDLVLTLIALASLWRRWQHTVLDMWLVVVMWACLFDVALSALLNGHRFDLGFYAGRAYGLLAATFVLMVFLSETALLYAELAKSFRAAHDRHKEESEKRHRTEVALAQQEDRERLYVAAVQSSFDAIVTKTLGGIITGWNPAAERLFEFTAEQAIGQSIEIIVPEERRAELRAFLASIARGEMVNHHETLRRTASGKCIEVSLSISPIKAPSGAIIGACKISRDVTAQKRIERMKDEFIATVSHELRTPVTAIAGSLGLLAGGAAGELSDRARRLVTMAHANSAKLVQLINDILDIDNIEFGEAGVGFSRGSDKRPDREGDRSQ